MNVKPMDDRVLLKPMEAEEKTAGGIIIPDNAKEKPQKGEVIAVGTHKQLKESSPEYIQIYSSQRSTHHYEL